MVTASQTDMFSFSKICFLRFLFSCFSIEGQFENVFSLKNVFFGFSSFCEFMKFISFAFFAKTKKFKNFFLFSTTNFYFLGLLFFLHFLLQPCHGSEFSLRGKVKICSSFFIFKSDLIRAVAFPVFHLVHFFKHERIKSFSKQS